MKSPTSLPMLSFLAAEGPGGEVQDSDPRDSERLGDTDASSSDAPAPSSGAEQDERSSLLYRFRRGTLAVAGLVFTGLAVAGVFLPLLPTTPFLLLAAACFARSSPQLHRWLLSNRIFGHLIEEWRRDRTVPRAAKTKAYLVVILAFGSSIALVDGTWLRALLLVLGTGVSVFLARIPTTRAPPGSDPPRAES